MFLRNAQAKRKNENKVLRRQVFSLFFLVGVTLCLDCLYRKVTELASVALAGVTYQYTYVKVKQSRYRPGVTQRVPGS
jgi:hypothetical protein